MGAKAIAKSYQKDGARFAVKHPYCILAMDMGLGKSYTALRAWQKSGGGKLTIVCPSSLLLNWKLEVFKWYGDKFIVSVFDKGASIYDVWDTDICIISFDLGKQSEFFFEWCDSLIIDEAHELKGMSAARTEYYHKVTYENSIPRLTLLTGTPIQNRVEEYYSLMALCYYNPDIKSDFLDRFPDSTTFADYFSWRQEYQIERGGRRVTIVKWTGFRNVKELKKYLKPLYFRVKFDDVEDLEPMVYKDILMSESPDKELAAEFKRLAKHYIEDEEYGAMNSRRKRESAIEKVPFTIKYAERLLNEVDCVLIYSDQVESCNLIAEHFGVLGLTGKVSGKIRGEHARKFQSGKGRVLSATIGALSTGLNMTRASDIIMNDEPWVPGKLDQVGGRIRRIGQTKTCTMHRIFGSPQDMKIADMLDDKRATIAKVT